MVKVSSIATFCWQEDGKRIDATTSSAKDEVHVDDDVDPTINPL